MGFNIRDFFKLPQVSKVADDPEVAVLSGNTMLRSKRSTLLGGSITTAALADALADQLPLVSISLANGSPADGKGYLTGQVKDAQGNNLTGRWVVEVWFGSTAYSAATDLGTLAVTTGTLLDAHKTDAWFSVVTDTNGAIAANLTMTSPGALYAQSYVFGKLSAANVTVTS